MSDCSDSVVDDDAIGWLVDETIVTGEQSPDAEKNEINGEVLKLTDKLLTAMIQQ